MITIMSIIVISMSISISISISLCGWVSPQDCPDTMQYDMVWYDSDNMA